jgi:hypothetical protein
MQAGMTVEECVGLFTGMDAATVPEKDDRTWDLPQEVAQEEDELGLRDVLPVEVEVKPEALPSGADGHGRDRGDAIVAIAVADDRGLTARSPGAAKVRDEEKPTLVQEGQVGLQALDSFLMAIQRYRFRRSITSLFLSTARRSGFWQDQPRQARSRPTCARWKRTLNSSSITSAIRCVVHRSVPYPQASAPRSRRTGSLFDCAGLSFGGRPGAGVAFSADSPFRRSVSRQRTTELCEQPRRRATPLTDRPLFSP